LNATDAVSAVFSGNWRGKSAGSSAYPAPATAFIKIRTLFKFFAARLFQPSSSGAGLP
jgi:hypothetical protein